LQDLWEYNSLSDTWSQKSDFAGIPRFNSVGISSSNKCYFGLGCNKSETNDFWEFK